ncbi:NUDIX domain-containing protein [Paracoccus aminophilus]|uniref:NUDIX hydrolase n=1 Tax=Paracoccus aminophilus JCM 7686 TaxID=1367847 RepID=S5XXH6_PARAH|nr:NUDIX domain-containing protein [Paracoccus aminophilus]AGT08135.1 NUDIX hydrolase [Paracoccus aminophilus JCM 7686]
MTLVTGPLAHPAMLAALGLAGTPVVLQGKLAGGAEAGIVAGDWPQLVEGAGEVAALRVVPTPALHRYAEIMQATPRVLQGETVLGLAADEHGAGQAADQPQSWPAADWPAALAAGIAARLVALGPERPAQAIRARLSRIGEWVAAQLRAADEHPAPVGPATEPRLEVLSRDEPYQHFFAVEHVRLVHRLNSGGLSVPLDRAVFVSGDATVVLPWDPLRDRVLLIDQFRAGPAVRGDREPWLYETVAGRIDLNESPEDAARREAYEEAGIALRALVPGPHHYPSPGAMAEYLYLFIGIADLPDGVAGIGGLASEGEDIRSHLVERATFLQMIRRGEIRNGPLLVLGLWLDAEAARLQAEYTG